MSCISFFGEGQEEMFFVDCGVYLGGVLESSIPQIETESTRESLQKSQYFSFSPHCVQEFFPPSVNYHIQPYDLMPEQSCFLYRGMVICHYLAYTSWPSPYIGQKVLINTINLINTPARSLQEDGGDSSLCELLCFGTFIFKGESHFILTGSTAMKPVYSASCFFGLILKCPLFE